MSDVIVQNTLINLSRQQLLKHAIDNEEGVLSATGALCVTTGKHTGRSPKDRFIVKDAMTADTIHWGDVNQPFSADKFTQLWQRAEQHLQGKPIYESLLQVGADAQFGIPVRVLTETAWHNLFAQNLFIHPDDNNRSHNKPWTILSVPSLQLDPKLDKTYSEGAVLINMTDRKTLLIGMRYAGEMKKSMFSVMNYFMPEQDVLPMHCAANVGEDGDTALFFGLSGTGKTTLSADPERYLIGDDEHGWSHDAVFNFEGGCYAKCINLSKENEPVIWDAIKTDAIMENVVLDEHTKQPNYADDSLTQNTRAAYPRDHIAKRVLENSAAQPKVVIFLACDLYGVLPPVAELNNEQAAYYFLSGYTAIVGGTERGHVGVKPAFSTCFGAPFFPRSATIYADLLIKRLKESGASVYLINTGWSGGGYGEGGERFAIKTTRAIVRAALNGDIRRAAKETMAKFHFMIPTALPGVDAKLLNPRNLWSDKAAFDKQAELLVQQFIDNFKQFSVDAAIVEAGPKASS